MVGLHGSMTPVDKQLVPLLELRRGWTSVPCTNIDDTSVL